MLPILKRLENIHFDNPRVAVRQLAEHIQDLENQIEDLLMKLDSANLLPLDLDDMKLYTDSGSEISGDRIRIVSPTGETFEVGYNKEKKRFIFTLPSEITVGTINADSIIRGGEEL